MLSRTRTLAHFFPQPASPGMGRLLPAFGIVLALLLGAAARWLAQDAEAYSRIMKGE